MVQLKLNADKNGTHDLVIIDGQLQLVSDHDYIIQKTKQILLFIKGEWFRNIELGIPWFTQIFVKPVNLVKIRGILRNALLNDSVLKELGVIDVVVSDLELSSASRKFTCKIEMKIDGETQTLKTGFTL